MVGSGAGGFPATRSIAGATDWAALLVTTDVSVQAVIVHPVLYLDTGHVGVPFVALLAGADWVVVDDPAEGVISTGAGVLTDLVDAGVCFSTLVISLTARQDWAESLAALVITSHIPVRTGADHRPH